MNDKRVVIAGGSGFIGRALTRALVARGDEVVVLRRRPPANTGPVSYVQWDGRTVGAWARDFDGATAVVNLTGKNVNCRYTRAALLEIDRSRINSVHAIAEAIRRCNAPPRVWVQAGTTAIYGDAGERWCDETTPIGEGVPVHTAAKWETSFGTTAMLTPGTRRVLLRIAFALGADGGALQTLVKLTRLYLGGAAGNGRQFISWVHRADLTRVFLQAIDRDDMRGHYVAATPNPVTNAAFMAELRRVLRRPWSPPTPAWAVHLGAFFMRTEPVLALTGRRCRPARLIEQGFDFEFPLLPAALDNLLGDDQPRLTASKASSARCRASP
jgi:uncharacterized protein